MDKYQREEQAYRKTQPGEYALGSDGKYYHLSADKRSIEAGHGVKMVRKKLGQKTKKRAK